MSDDVPDFLLIPLIGQTIRDADWPITMPNLEIACNRYYGEDGPEVSSL